MEYFIYIKNVTRKNRFVIALEKKNKPFFGLFYGQRSKQAERGVTEKKALLTEI